MRKNPSPFGYFPGKGKIKKAFTLVELIVVITILAILGTIAFMSFQGYSRDSRDSVRISDLKNIEVGLELYKTKVGKYPTADNSVEITASGILFSYQGVVGDSLLSKLRISNGGKDPVDQTYYTYMTTSNLYQYELMGFLENGNKISFQVPSKSPHPNPLPEGEGIAPIFSQANAASYLDRFPKVIGDELGILLDSTTNQPIQSTGTGVDILKTTTNYKAYFNTTKSVTGTGGALFSEYYNRTRALLTDKTLAKQDPSLVLYMDMETTTTSGSLIVLKDLSQYGNNGSCYNSGTVVDCGSATGPQFQNKGMHFDGIDDYVRITDDNTLDLTNNFSIFVKIISEDYVVGNDGQPGRVLYKDAGVLKPGYPVYDLFFSSNALVGGSRFTNSSGFSTYFGDSFVGKNNVFLGYFYKNIYSIYSNGVKLNLNYDGGFSGSLASTSGDLYIGKKIGFGSTIFKGIIQSIRIYNRALSDTEIKSLYDSSK